MSIENNSNSVLQELEFLEDFLRDATEEEIREAAKYIFNRVKRNVERLENSQEQHLAPRFMAVLSRVKNYLSAPQAPSRGFEYRSCGLLERFSLTFSGRIDTGRKCLVTCCEPGINAPGAALCETAEETVKNFAKERANIIAESIRLGMLGNLGADEERKYTSECAKCSNFLSGNWSCGGKDQLVQHVNLSMYPAPCNSKCIYCVERINNTVFDKRTHAEYYEKLFDIVEWAQKNNMIAANATWQVSSGEITIHPYKDRIYDLIKDSTATFLTNGFIYDEKIGANLAANQHSGIFMSIDCGTPQTWNKIKGVNNFDTVMDNLSKYLAISARPGQIILKYIILPGINDDTEEYRSVIKIMNDLKVRHMTIACDLRTNNNKYSHDKEQREDLIKSAGLFVAMLHKNGMASGMHPAAYTLEEADKAAAYANELLKSGVV